MVVQAATRLLQRGPLGTVEYAIRQNEAMEAKQWLEAQLPAKQASFDHLFRVIVAHGRISNHVQFKQLRNEVHEFKRGPDRIFCFKLGGRWLLTHHREKASLKNYNGDINRAMTIAAEHIAYEARHQQ
jgi:Phage derived protein Gp49-like (DUF891)